MSPVQQPRVRSTNVSRPKPAGGRAKRLTGIDKRPVPQIEVAAPGPDYGAGSGVAGDLVGDSEHHGGAQKAVYAFSRSELDRWERELGRDLPDGHFGENLTLEGLDLEAGLVINQRLAFRPADRASQPAGDDVVLEVSIPRTPCATFAIHMGVRGWTRAFAERGRCGVYLRVVHPGVIRAGDLVEPLEAPGHGITMVDAFAAAMGDDEAARRIVGAGCLPPLYHDRHVQRLGLQA